jgi:hypothetical protein
LTFRRAAALSGLVVIATLTFTSASTARPPSPPSSLDPLEFQVVVLPQSTRVDGSPMPVFDLGRPASPTPIGDFQEQTRSFEPRVAADQPVRAESLLKPTPKPKPKPAVTSSGGSGGTTSRSGTASWYCKAGVSACHYKYSSGLYAAAGPALRVGDWRGRNVRVCASGNCVRVTLIDWCQCYGSRVIDLYSDAFQRLAPLSSGTVKVTVSW